MTSFDLMNIGMTINFLQKKDFSSKEEDFVVEKLSQEILRN
jgi:hypothetical protein